jgi:hypothetical protein
MKVKNVSNQIIEIANGDPFLLSYIRDMQSEIYKVSIPDYFVGTPYKKLAQIFYLCNVKVDFEATDPSLYS